MRFRIYKNADRGIDSLKISSTTGYYAAKDNIIRAAAPAKK